MSSRPRTNPADHRLVRPCAAELALGLFAGQERAAAVAHLQECPSCQAEVDQLSCIADMLLLAAPSVEPPVGFELRLSQQLADRDLRFRRRRRLFGGSFRMAAQLTGAARPHRGGRRPGRLVRLVAVD